jgi:hypothetical protein
MLGLERVIDIADQYTSSLLIASTHHYAISAA